MLNYKFTFCFKITTRWNLTRSHATILNQLNIIGNGLRNLRDTMKNTFQTWETHTKKNQGYPQLWGTLLDQYLFLWVIQPFAKMFIRKNPKDWRVTVWSNLEALSKGCFWWSRYSWIRCSFCCFSIHWWVDWNYRIYNKLNIKSGTFCEKYCELQDAKWISQMDRKSSDSAKQRRKKLPAHRNRFQDKFEKNKGVSYEVRLL